MKNPINSQMDFALAVHNVNDYQDLASARATYLNQIQQVNFKFEPLVLKAGYRVAMSPLAGLDGPAAIFAPIAMWAIPYITGPLGMIIAATSPIIDSIRYGATLRNRFLAADGRANEVVSTDAKENFYHAMSRFKDLKVPLPLMGEHDWENLASEAQTLLAARENHLQARAEANMYQKQNKMFASMAPSFA